MGPFEGGFPILYDNNIRSFDITRKRDLRKMIKVDPTPSRVTQP